MLSVRDGVRIDIQYESLKGKVWMAQNVELPCGSMSLIYHSERADSISNIYQDFLDERHIILMTFYPLYSPVA